jgi:4,5-DOPA dioxygenase extradiol
VLKHVYPDADVPVLQLSIDGTQPPRYHYETGRRLAPLRDEGILIAGSGNVVHNLRLMKRGGAQAYDWALRFNETIRDALAARDHATLIDFEKLGESARLSVPTPEHYLPLLYVAGLQESDESMSFPVDGYDLGSISMLTAAAGLPGR